MDALYLKENINDAITEALTSMVVSVPDDPIEYLGNYLLNYVDRKTAMRMREKISSASDIVAGEEAEAEQKKNVDITLKNDERLRYEKKLTQYIEGLSNIVVKKEDAFASVTKFISEYLSIPAVYIAVKKPVGESVALHYMSACPGQEMMVGKKLLKPAEAEGDEAPTRQGLSFEAFKIPEVPEEEPLELEEGQEPPPPKPAPKAEPLIVDNTMRDTRCKFFGIPKLGSYVAVPFVLNSIEHDQGCILGPQPEPVPPSENPEDPAPVQPEPEPLYVMNKMPVHIMIGMDTIGSYRRFSPKEIEITKAVGDSLIAVLEGIETKVFDSHLDYITASSVLIPSIIEVAAKLPEAEASALAVTADIGETPIMDTLKMSKEADALSAVYTSTLSTPPVSSFIDALQGHMLPPTQSAMNLLFGLLNFLGCDSSSYKDVCGDPSWSLMRLNALPDLMDMLNSFSHTNLENPSFTDATMKAYIEANGLGDVSVLPSSLPILPIIATWITKMITSRETRILYTAAKAEADAAAAEAEAARLAAEAEAAAAAAPEE